MTKSELQCQNELADSLIAKLERIKTLWEEMPNEDAMETLVRQADGIASDLEKAKEVYNADDFPSDFHLDELIEKTGRIAQNLEDAKEAQEELPEA